MFLCLYTYKHSRYFLMKESITVPEGDSIIMGRGMGEGSQSRKLRKRIFHCKEEA